MDVERARARGEFEELKLKAEELRMAGEDARAALGEAMGVFRPLESIETARVVFLSAQLVSTVVNLKEVKASMDRIRDRYGF